jgi:predicted permease
VVIELGMALVLLTGAGLMIRSLTRLWSVDPGFDAHNILTLNISLAPPMMKASASEIRAAFREVDRTVAASPDIEAAAISWGAVPMQGDDEVLFWKDGQPKPSSSNDMSWSISYVVGPEYLKVMRIPLLHGRFFDVHDDEHSQQVAVVDDVFAEKFFPGEDAIGKRLHLSNPEQTVEIVGMVRHVKQWGLDADDKQALRAQMYRPFNQLPDSGMALSPSGTGIIVRSKAPAPWLFESIRGALRQMNSEQVVFGPQTMEETIAASLAARRYSMILLGAFAALALLLAGIGIYGVMAYVVGQRTQEIGIRMALGARRMHVLGMILGQGCRLIVVGVAAGIAAGLALTRLMASLLFGVTATDPVTFLCVAGLLALVALLACLAPARRATRVDPMVALRCE